MDKKLVVILMTFTFLILNGCVSDADRQKEAETVYVNGNIYTVDNEFSKAKN